MQTIQRVFARKTVWFHSHEYSQPCSASNQQKSSIILKLLMAFMMIFSFSQSNAQSTTLTTLPASTYNGSNGAGVNFAVTFVLENTNAFPILLTGASTWVNTGEVGTYQLWYSSTSLGGLPTPIAAPTWSMIAQATSVPAPAVSGITPVLSGMSFVIPANTQYRFAMWYVTTSSHYSGSGPLTPNTFSGGGVTMKVCDVTIPGSPAPSYVGYGGPNNPRGFTGSVTFQPFGPCIDPPTAGVASSSPSNICVGQSTSLNMVGGTGGSGQTYQWKSSTVSGGPYTNVGASTFTSALTVSPTVPTYYVCETTCGSGTATSTETSVFVPTPFPGGNYTINSALPTGGTNFASFTDAVSAISCGIAGPVVFDVDPLSGPYTEQISLPATIGSNAINTVTFNGNGRTLQFNSTNANARHIIKLDGADYITFNDLIIDGSAAAATYAWGVHLMNGADYNTFSLCNIKTSITNTTSSNHYPVVMSASITSPTTLGNTGSYNTFTDNIFSGGYYGVSMYGGGTGTENVGNNFINNAIKDFYFYGIIMAYEKNCLISACDFSRPNRTTSSTTAGVYQSTSAFGNTIENCRVHNLFDAMLTNTSTVYGFYMGAAGTALAPNVLINNVVSDINHKGPIYGIYNSAASFSNIYHNTISLDFVTTGITGVTYGIYSPSLVNAVNFKNNVITITRGTSTAVKIGMYFANTSTALASNNNVVYLNTTGTGVQSFGSWSGTAYATKALWNAATGQDANSVQADPVYTNPAIGDFTPTAVTTNNTGANVGVAYDIIGTPRSGFAPDAGAFEYDLFGLDAGISWVSPISPAVAGMQTIMVSLSNNLSTPITSVTLAYTEIGGTPVVETFSGLTFLPSTAQGFTFAVPFNLTSSTSLRAYIVDVNGTTDFSQANDSTNLQYLCLSLAGTYTIDATSPASPTNFQSFNALATALNCGGVAGPVTVNVVAGTGPYNERVTFGSIINSSVVNTVTINGNGNVLTSVDAADYHTLRLNGADFMSWSDLTVNATGATNGFPLMMSNGSDNNNFVNCNFNASLTSTSSLSSCVVFSSSTTSPTSTGNNGNNNVFDGCNMSGGYYCITVYGNSTVGGSITGNQFLNCTVKDFYFYGLYNAYATNTTVNGCTFERPNRTTISSGYGVYLTTGSLGCLVIGNRVRKMFENAVTGTNACYALGCVVAATVGNENKFINNLVSDIRTNGTIYGLYLSGGSFVQAYHNTISLDHTAATAGATYGIYSTGASNSFQNNLVSITRGGTGTKYLAYYSSLPLVSNYNNFYLNSAAGTNYLAYMNATNYATLAAYSSANPLFDQQTIGVNPFYNNTALGDYTPTDVSMNDLGTNLGITTDITGAARPASPSVYPDMGAYEFSVAPIDLGMFSFDGPGTSGCYSATQDVTVSIKNYGTSPIDFSVNPATISCDVTGAATATLTANPTGILAPGATMTVVLGPGFNMTASGSYTFGNIGASMTGDGLASNNMLSSTYTRTVGVIAGTISTPSINVCVTSPSPTITLSGNYGGAIQWQESTVSTSGPWTNVGTGAQTFIPAPFTAAEHYYQAVVSCNGNVVTTNPLTIFVNTPLITGTTPGSRCGTGSVNLGATAAGTSSVQWFANPTGGVSLGTGTTFATPSIATTTNFYAEAVTGAGLLTGLGCTAVPTSSGFNAKRGIQFDAYQAFTLVSSQFYAAYAGTTNMTIELQNSAGVVLQTLTVNETSASATAGWHTVPLNLNILPGTGYKLLCQFNSGSLSNYSHGSGANYALPAFNNLGPVGLITSGMEFGPVANASVYYYFYNLEIAAGCNSVRVPVTATVNTSPTASVTNSNPVICQGLSSTLAATSSNDPNYTYTWMPGSLTGSSVVVTPSATTVYTLTATDNTTGTYANCADVQTTTVTVNPLPTPVTATATPSTICAGGNSIIGASGGVPPPSGYCYSTFTTGTGSGDYCTLVSIAGTTLNSVSGASTSPYYTVFPATGNTTATFVAGNTYTVTLSAGTYTSNDFAIWTDYNQNGIFEATEKGGEVDNIAAGPVTTTITFTVPAGAYNGTTRFRVHEADQGTTGGMLPCAALSFGEIEDYIITITGGVNQGNFTWSPATNLSSTTSNPTTATALSATETYTATFTNGYGCTASGNVTVTVNPTSSSTTTASVCTPPYTWNGNTYTVSGTYTYTTTNAVGCDSVATLNLTIAPCNTTLNLTCFIQGYWDGTSQMQPVLLNQGEPTTTGACDSIIVELHSDVFPYGIDATTTAVLNQNGTATCIFPPVTGNKYIAVKHRSAVQTWSTAPVAMGTTVSYNFSTAANMAFGDNQVEVSTSPSIWAFYSGDIVVDENVDLLDLGNLETEISNFSFGYISADVNGDGNVDLLDSPLLEINISNFIYSNHP